MNIHVVYNPEGAADEIALVRELLGSKGIDAEFTETQKDQPGETQAKMAVGAGADLVLAVGGDGTVRAVAEGVSGSGVPMAVIPAGTGNLLARNMSIPMEVDEALEVALAGRKVSLDSGRVNGELFTVMSGAGLDAMIMRDTSSESKDRLGALAYVIEGAKHVFDDPFDADITDADGVRCSGSFATILVGNLGRLQGGVDLFPESSPRDGVLDLVGLRSESTLDTLAAGASAAAESTESDRLLRMTAERFQIEFRGSVAYELDGEARDAVASLEYTIEPESLIVMTREEQV